MGENEQNSQARFSVPRIWLTRAFLGSVSLLTIGILGLLWRTDWSASHSKTCENNINISPSGDTQDVIKKGRLSKDLAYCFSFVAKEGQTIGIIRGDSNLPLTLFDPKGKITNVPDNSDKLLLQSGKHFFKVENNTDSEQIYYFVFTFSEETVNASADKTDGRNSTGSELNERTVAAGDGESSLNESERSLTYNIKKQPVLRPDRALQETVIYAVDLAEQKGLPTQQLSIALIDVDQRTIGAYQENQLFFPASVSKLFWLIALFGYYDSRQNFEDKIDIEDLKAMMQDSDNNPASRVLDALTDTRSGENLTGAELDKWISKRESINYFYTKAGYPSLNINQKNFPIPDEKLEDPIGSDKVIRGKNEEAPIRNALSAFAIARLLYEIETEQAISPYYSQKAKELMQRDFAIEATKQYDSIIGFLGEGLNPDQITLYSKPGWTSGSRQDAAIIHSADSSVRYILVVMGDDKSYAEDDDIFPDISSYIYDRMTGVAQP